MEGMTRRIIGMTLLIAVFLTGIFVGFSLLSRQAARKEIKSLRSEAAKLKSNLAVLKTELENERTQPNGLSGEVSFTTAAQVYDFFMESASLAQLNVTKVTMKPAASNPGSQAPLELTLNGNYPHLLSFFGYLTDRHCLYSVTNLTINAVPTDPVNTLQCTMTMIVPLRREGKP